MTVLTRIGHGGTGRGRYQYTGHLPNHYAEYLYHDHAVDLSKTKPSPGGHVWKRSGSTGCGTAQREEIFTYARI